MKIHHKAVIYSTIVFPGAGYFILSRKYRAVTSLAITGICLSVFMVEAYHKAQIIAAKIVQGSIPFDIIIIREQILITTGTIHPYIVSITLYCLIAIWLISVIDCYRIGKDLK